MDFLQETNFHKLAPQMKIRVAHHASCWCGWMIYNLTPFCCSSIYLTGKKNKIKKNLNPNKNPHQNENQTPPSPKWKKFKKKTSLKPFLSNKNFPWPNLKLLSCCYFAHLRWVWLCLLPIFQITGNESILPLIGI